MSTESLLTNAVFPLQKRPLPKPENIGGRLAMPVLLRMSQTDVGLKVWIPDFAPFDFQLGCSCLWVMRARIRFPVAHTFLFFVKSCEFPDTKHLPGFSVLFSFAANFLPGTNAAARRGE